MFKLNDYKERQILTKESLLKYITELDVFTYYVPNIVVNTTISSPFRKDERPSFSVFYSEKLNMLLFKDFKGLQGDFIVFVQKLFSMNRYQAMSQIAIDFNIDYLFIISVDIKRSSEKINFKVGQIYKPKTKKELNVKIRPWRVDDFLYWKLFGISKDTLVKYRVLPIAYYTLNEHTFKADKYAYVYLEYKDDKITYKVYQPFSKKWKWFNNQNKTIHAGYTQLPAFHKMLILTKSLKDVMSINELTGYPVVSIQSENYVISLKTFNEYKNRFSNIITLFDNDEVGVECAAKYTDIYGLPSALIPIKHRVKDFSDLVKKIGKEDAVEVLQNILLF